MKIRTLARGIVPLLAALVVLALSALSVAQDTRGFLSTEEREWISNLSRPIVLAATPANRPLEYLDEHGDYQGMVADYAKILEKKLNVRFEVVEPSNMKELLEMARNREIDVISAFVGNPARIDYMQFTRPYLVLPTTILVNKNQKQFLTLEEMHEQKMELALPKEYGVIDYVRKYYPEIHIQPTYNYLAALLHVSFDEIDATIISLPQASYFIEEKGITNLRAAGHTEYNIYNRIAVRSDWPELTRILQKGLDTITKAEHTGIYRKWVRLEQNSLTLLLQNKHLWAYAAGTVLLLILTFAAIILWNRTLRRRVNAATSELQMELQSGRRMLTAIEQAQDGIFILDPDATIVYANPAFQKMLGLSEKELLGTPIASLRHEKHDEGFFRTIWDHIHKGETWSGQASYFRRDGSELTGDITVTPVLNEQKQVINIVEVIRDVTEKLKMEAHLRQSQKMEELGTLAGGIAHDFNNIVAAIMGYAELALPTVEQDTRAQTNLLRIKKVATRARDMVNQILVFSRRREPEHRRVDLASVVHEVVNLLRSSLPSTIEIVEETNAQGAVMADPSQVHQVIMNLGTNAGYAMRETGGTLTIRLSRYNLGVKEISAASQLSPGHHLLLEVSDTGTGLPPGIADRIFDPFFTTKPQGEGTGMGLAMVHGIVGSMDGEIRVTSQLGEGTTFRILLPLADDTGVEENRCTDEAVPGQGRILLVDDEEDLVAINSQFLEDLGYKVTGTSNSRAALDLFMRAPNEYDLVITDQTMPALTGTQLAEAIHAECPEMPIILCTGYTERIRHLSPGQFGIRKILMKPFELVEFSQVVKSILDNKHSS